MRKNKTTETVLAAHSSDIKHNFHFNKVTIFNTEQNYYCFRARIYKLQEDGKSYSEISKVLQKNQYTIQ